MMTDIPARVTGRFNLRDLAGLPTPDGRQVVAGQVIRCGHLVDLSDDEIALVQGLAPRMVLDLRTEHERSTTVGLELPGTEHVWLDVLGAEASAHGPAGLTRTMRSPVEATQTLGDGRIDEIFTQSYRDLVTLPTARAAYAGLLRAVLQPGTGPVLFHCTAGKDRTGWAAAVILAVLGVARDVITADYLETNTRLLTASPEVVT